MDEREFVRFLKGRFPLRRVHGLGIGDDCSAIRQKDGSWQLVTNDILVEGVHFRREFFTYDQLALKALAVNVSDIAAMGGEPLHFYLGLGLPAAVPAADWRRFFLGLRRGCRRWRLDLAGGDFSRAPHIFISITVVGRAQRPVWRSGARAGDWIGITGRTGESAMGLRLLLRGERSGRFVRAHKAVRPELSAGRTLASFASAMIDVSDGLLLDLQRVLEASGRGGTVEYERVPVTPSLRRACRSEGIDERELVLAGGEDYVLLFTVSPGREPALRSTGLQYHLIGRVESTSGLRVLQGGRRLRLRSLGYDHFRQPQKKGRP